MREDDISNYEKLIVWQKAMDLVEGVYLNSQNFPKSEKYALVDQLKRAVTSIPLNIAEGQTKGSKKDFRRFLLIARGSTHEVNCILQIALRLGYIKEENYLKFRKDVLEISKMISGLIGSLEEKAFKEKRVDNTEGEDGK